MSASSSNQSLELYNLSRSVDSTQKSNSIIHYKRKVRIIQKITLPISVVLLLFALFSPWQRTRDSAYSSSYYLLGDLLDQKAEALSTFTSTVFQNFEIVSDFLVHVNQDPATIRCDETAMVQLLKYTDSVHSLITPPPHGFTLLQGNQTLCHVEWDSISTTSDYHLHYSFKDENGEYITKCFDSNEITHPLDPYNSGHLCSPHFSESYARLVSDTVGQNTHWTDILPVVNISRELPQISSYAKFGQTNDNYSVALVSLDTHDLYEQLLSFSSIDNLRFALINPSGGIILDSGTGLVKPLKIDNNGVPTYPKVEEYNSSFWQSFQLKLQEMGDNAHEQLIVGEDHYLITTKSVFPTRESSHIFYAALKVDPFIESAFEITSIVFVLCSASIVILLFTCGLMMQHNKNRLDAKLNRQQDDFNQNLTYGKNLSTGALGKAIELLRQLQLTYPEDLMINRSLDSAVTNLTEHHKRSIFLLDSTSKNCPFCSLLESEPHKCVGTIIPSVYSQWKSIAQLYVKRVPNVSSSSFEWSSFESNPERNLSNTVITYLFDQDLWFPELDPDMLVMFIVDYSKQFCKGPMHVIHRVHKLLYLLKYPFKHWISSKYDLLVLILSALVKTTNIENAQNLFPGCFEMFEGIEDEITNREREIEFVCYFISQYFPKSPLLDSLTSDMRDMLKYTHKTNQFTLINKINVRVVSPEFSVTNNASDCKMMMQLFLCFSDYCHYWCQEDMNYYSALFLPEDIRSDPVLRQKVNYQVGVSIVAQLLILLKNYSDLKTISDGFHTTLNYLSKK